MSGMRVLVLAVLGCGSLIACGDSPPEETAAPTTSTRKAPKDAGLPPDMVAAVSASRSSGVIGVHFALGKQPVVGQALPVEIAIVPHQDFTSVSAHFDGVDGLAVTVGDAMQPTTGVKAETIIKHQLVLLPTKEGVFMISAGLETESPTEGTVSRVFSLPLIVSAEEKPPETTAAPAPAPAAAP